MIQPSELYDLYREPYSERPRFVMRGTGAQLIPHCREAAPTWALVPVPNGDRWAPIKHTREALRRHCARPSASVTVGRRPRP